MGSASLESVESGASLGLQLGGAGGMFPHDEDARYQAGEEGEDCKDHKLNNSHTDAVVHATDGDE